MKKIAVEDAIGMELCADITEMKDGFKGPAFRRGHIIREEDIEHLKNIGKKSVFIWEAEKGELHEEDCAIRMSRMAQVKGAHYEGPSEGKVMLKADTEGMFRVNTGLLEKINSIEDITISTIPDHYPVKPGMKLASMRIVPLVTKESNIEEAEKLCASEKLLELYPYKNRKAGVIVTGSEVYSGRIKDKFEPVVRKKLLVYPAEILGVTICDDDVDMITEAAKKYLAEGADFLIFTGGMSVDPDDVTPTAIRKLGAEIITHGVPSQPGNMTLAAYLGETAILGIPGAAISLPTTIFDVLLPQIFAGVRLTKEDLIHLGDGGLCQSCGECHFPNCTFGRY